MNTSKNCPASTALKVDEIKIKAPTAEVFRIYKVNNPETECCRVWKQNFSVVHTSELSQSLQEILSGLGVDVRRTVKSLLDHN